MKSAKKLFLEIVCPMCKGSRLYSAGGHYDALTPGKWGACPYCNPATGTTFVEATVERIIDYLVEQDSDIKERIVSALSEDE
jgi:hypothetical protein